jgi:hypothetical protein
MGFEQFLRRDGLTYRLVPVENDRVNTDFMLDKVTNKFKFGSANVPGVYFDEENRRQLNTLRTAYADLALDLASKNRKEDAKKVLNQIDKMMLDENMPYGMASRGNSHNRNSLLFLEACYLAGDTALANKVSNSVKKDLEQQIRFYNSLTGRKAELMEAEKRGSENYLQAISQMQTIYNPKLQIPGKMMAADSAAQK